MTSASFFRSRNIVSSAMADHGEICSKPPFTWSIINLHEVINKRYNRIFSPDFIFQEAKWYLVFNYCSSTEANFYLRLKDPRGVDSLSVSYKLSIVDTEGRDYWSSDTETKNFTYCDLWGPYQFVSLTDLQRDLPKITRRGVLSLQLKFYPEDPPLSPTVQDARSTTITVGTQTGDELSQFQSCSTHPEGMHNILQNQKELYLKEKDCDCTIVVGERQFHTHQLILKCHSPVFDNMFRHEMTEKKNGVVEIPHCDPDVFHHFLLFLYSGELEYLTCDNVVQLHYISQKYEVEKLSASCIQFMIENLTVETFCDFVIVGLQHSEMTLVESANNIFTRNLKQIFMSEKWKKLYLEYPTESYELLKKALDRN